MGVVFAVVFALVFALVFVAFILIHLPGTWYITRGLRRGGLTPACSSAHARNGRGCRQIEAVSSIVLPRGALRKVHGCVRLCRER